MLPKPPKPPDRPANLRPINLASVILKLMELPDLGKATLKKRRYICESLVNSYFAKQQEGFRKGHGTAQGLIKISQVIQGFLSYGNDGVVLALDFAKAFDTVSQCELLRAMKDAKITTLGNRPNKFL